MNKIRINRLDFVMSRIPNFNHFLPPNTVVLDSEEDFRTLDFILTVKYDFNWTVNRVSPRGDNIGADYDFRNDDI